MLFILTNRTRQGLSPEQFQSMATLAKAFYANVPPGVRLLGEWAAEDGTHNYTLMEAPDLATVQALQAPFQPYTESSIVAVKAISGWTAS